MRHLVSVRRHVPLDIVDTYLAGWSELRRAVENAGGRAWLYRGAANEDRFIEFVEWSDDIAAPLSHDAVAAAAAELDAFAAPASTDEWDEAG
ncbi:MAG TPA: hypothetical protein VFZ24_17180 [Longimicrobiales bacterium]